MNINRGHMLSVVISSILYVVVGCTYCHRAEQELDKACISYQVSTDNSQFNVAPVLKAEGHYYIGLDMIEGYIKTHDRCK